MRRAALLIATACVGLTACTHAAKPWKAASGTVPDEDCAIYRAIAPTLGDTRKFLLHPVTVPTLAPNQGFTDPDALPGFTMAEVAALDAERARGGEKTLAIACDWAAHDLPKDAFAWKSGRSYDLAFSPVLRNTDGRLAIVDVSHNDTVRRRLRAMRYILGKEGDEWLIAGYYSLPPEVTVEIGPVTRVR